LDQLQFDRDVHAYSRAVKGDRAVRIGPFVAGFDDHDDGLFFNYAVPDDHRVVTDGEIAALIAAFTERARTPRLEYLPQLCPGLADMLVSAGFVVERRLPVLVCDPGQVVGPSAPDGIDLVLADTDEQLLLAAQAQNEAYGRPEVTDHDVTRLRDVLRRGGLVALAADRASGVGVGAAMCTPPHRGVSELTAVGVRAPYRRRGIAAALTALATLGCRDVGISTPFLTPAGDAEERVYRSVGYRRVTEMLHISRS
jgi:GNAT superfamily N-acetyltransferase